MARRGALIRVVQCKHTHKCHRLGEEGAEGVAYMLYFARICPFALRYLSVSENHQCQENYEGERHVQQMDDGSIAKLPQFLAGNQDHLRGERHAPGQL